MSSSPIECLVTWKERKQVPRVGGDRKKSDVFNAAMLTDSWTSLRCDRIEVYNSRFDTYVEVQEGHVFCDGDRINLVASGSSSNEENFLLEPGTADEGPLVLAPSCSEPNREPPTFKQLLYELPAVPLDIKADIEGTALGEISSRTKGRIVSWITTHLLTIDLYPGHLYEPAARALVLKYPVLRDTIGTGYDSWRVAFQYKMGNIRKSVHNDPYVEEARKKFGRKGHFPSNSTAKKQCRLPRAPLETGGEEDESVIAAHVEFMIKEAKRGTPDFTKLQASMKSTFSSRRKWIQQNRPSTTLLLERYPALTFRELLRQEFIAITKMDFEPKLLSFINTYGERCFQLLKSSRPAKKAFSEVQEVIAKADGDAKKYYFAVGVLELLPHLVKEDSFYLRGPSYPSLVLSDKAHLATEICATFESLKVDAVNIISGISTLMEIYWVMDIQYSRKNKNTFALFEYFCGLQSAPLTPLVMRAVSLIKKI